MAPNAVGACIHVRHVCSAAPAARTTTSPPRTSRTTTIQSARPAAAGHHGARAGAGSGRQLVHVGHHRDTRVGAALRPHLHLVRNLWAGSWASAGLARACQSTLQPAQRPPRRRTKRCSLPRMLCRFAFIGLAVILLCVAGTKLNSIIVHLAARCGAAAPSHRGCQAAAWRTPWASASARGRCPVAAAAAAGRTW